MMQYHEWIRMDTEDAAICLRCKMKITGNDLLHDLIDMDNRPNLTRCKPQEN